MSTIFIDSTTHYYKEKEVLSGVYLACNVGEVVGLLGRNGCGKSTLLKAIFGSITPHFKYLNINGKKYDKGYLSKNLSYLPQDRFIPDQINLGEAIDLFCHNYQNRLKEIPLITKHLENKFYNLSGGECRFIECLLMIYSNAQFVLLDEPFSQLSPIWVEELKIHIQTLKGEKGFIITDHLYRSILDISDRIVLIHNRRNYTINSEDDLILHGYLPGFTV
ncbi:ATP-binding cassette domain-containing protein [Pedobacter rhizosphaerae]|uniref:ABC-type lipopolysaccharide export system, ATPase component n=1 Tax=Pedobacter rhizosphaerae TaxID=390241 RepID=A0A1H9SQ80_9SPHI|nr:ATP-binding cassette domain-containing protein [Pedobacter rhizosphaerae]SER87091.1 ABC-type lipopolysaccharide export system, ATPase component [Pedobacter rhizosphaerae]